MDKPRSKKNRLGRSKIVLTVLLSLADNAIRAERLATRFAQNAWRWLFRQLFRWG
ncbi:hypothetical protein ACFSR7_08605 [Cohnella sp. GCM10020058]|uniref:hypothetical protein n=1 Tax=Cohnella sp. GCM10020058 TaxID=3317330 RepID=UPI003637C0BD